MQLLLVVLMSLRQGSATPLHCAVLNGHVEAAVAFIECGVDVNYPSAAVRIPALWKKYSAISILLLR